MSLSLISAAKADVTTTIFPSPDPTLLGNTTDIGVSITVNLDPSCGIVPCTNPSIAAATLATVNWGDGSTAQFDLGPIILGETNVLTNVLHNYTTAQTFTVTFSDQITYEEAGAVATRGGVIPGCAIAAIGAPSVAALVMNPLRSEWLANSAGSSPTAAQRRLIMRETVRSDIRALETFPLRTVRNNEPSAMRAVLSQGSSAATGRKRLPCGTAFSRPTPSWSVLLRLIVRTMPSEWRATSLTFRSTSSDTRNAAENWSSSNARSRSPAIVSAEIALTTSVTTDYKKGDNKFTGKINKVTIDLKKMAAPDEETAKKEGYELDGALADQN
jgi:hypothetical protein